MDILYEMKKQRPVQLYSKLEPDPEPHTFSAVDSKCLQHTNGIQCL